MTVVIAAVRLVWGSVPDWVVAVGTLAALTGTLYLLVLQRRQLREQGEALGLQGRALQLEIERLHAERTAVERAQADRVWAWFGWPPGAEHVADPDAECVQFHNGSDLFVYEAVAVVVDWRYGPRVDTVGRFVTPGTNVHEPPTLVSVALAVPPGDTYRMIVTGGGAMGLRAGIEVAFTDAAGRHWARRIGGALEQLDQPAAEHYGLGRPLHDAPWAQR